jgi:hypothetical protein
MWSPSEHDLSDIFAYVDSHEMCEEENGASRTEKGEESRRKSYWLNPMSHGCKSIDNRGNVKITR